MARAVCIANPRAARAAAPRAARRIRDVFARAGWRIEVETTTGPGDARRLAAEALAAGVEVVVVYGGDGTAMQAAAALVGTEVPLGLIAGGTGNLLAGNLRLPRRPAAAAAALLRNRPRKIDVGRVERTDGAHYFAVGAGAGFDAVMMRDTSHLAKRRWGMLAYIATGVRALAKLSSVPHTVVVDGTPLDCQAAMVLVANCPEIVPRLVRLRADVRLDDGVLDVFVARVDSLTEAARATWELCRGQAGNGSLFRHLRGHVVQVRADPPRPVQLDGESIGETPFTAVLLPGGLTVLAP